jgi:hypothetical protein
MELIHPRQELVGTVRVCISHPKNGRSALKTGGPSPHATSLALVSQPIAESTDHPHSCINPRFGKDLCHLDSSACSPHVFSATVSAASFGVPALYKKRCHPNAATTDDPSTAVATRPSCDAPTAAAVSRRSHWVTMQEVETPLFNPL